ncbi:unnamed protein product [Allacma fusca]|uniref:Uncharacterized protein n=1 Tax=Allacma fusca TaxID=39272 RepID=A0A8J2JIB2_9HEXA|nr:unnamed protein product [Allacma fusca]
MHLAAGLSFEHVQVLANLIGAFTTGSLAALLVHTFYVHTRKALHQKVGIDLKNVKYLHSYSTLLSRVSFYWLTPLLCLGYRQPLEEEHLGELPPEEGTVHQFERFYEYFQAEKAKADSEARQLSLWKSMFKTLCSSIVISGIFRLAADCSGFVAPLGIKYIVDYAGSNATLNTVGEDPVRYLTMSQLTSNGYVMAFIILLSAVLQSTFSQISTFLVNSEGIHIKIALQALIYKKSLTLSLTKTSNSDHQSSNSSESDDASSKENDDDSSSSGSGFEKGSILNLMSEDTKNIMSFFWQAHFIWAIPLKLLILMVLLYLQLGYSALIGAATCIAVMIPAQYVISVKCMSPNSKEYMERCDERLRAISEILQGMKLLKLHGWELIFSQQVFSIRKKELRNLDKDMLYVSIMTFLTHISTIVVTVVTFGLYSYIEQERLVPSKVFAGLALFNQLTVPLFIFPGTVSVVIEALVSVRRVREYLLSPEATPLQHVDPPKAAEVPETKERSRDLNASSDSVFQLENIVEDEENEEDFADSGDAEGNKDGDVSPESVVSIRAGDFSWDRDDHGLTDISLKIPRGKLTVIVGTTGSGKSSLIFALLGEMRRVTGEFLWASGSTISYAGQKSWMLNASVRENITFGRHYKPRRFLKAVEACALQEDINILPERDSTEIGEKGINLSGGQKQRIAIARTIYSDAEVIILDDPLSALDVDVAHHVFDSGIRKFLLRSKRTVILVTHHLPVLRHAHHIICMERGRIRIQGTLADIKVQDPTLHAEWTEIMTQKEAEIQKQQETKTAKERWSLLKLVSKIGLQFKHRNSEGGIWKVSDDPKGQLDTYRKRKGTFSHYKHLSHDIFSPSDEHHDELMTPLLRRRCVSRTSRGSRTSSSSNKHPELVRMTSLQNDSTTKKTKSPHGPPDLQRLQSLPADDEPRGSSASPPTIRSRSGTDSGGRLKEVMFRKMFHTKKPGSVSSSISEIDKNSVSQRLPSAVSGISEEDEEDEDVEETMLRPDHSHDERDYGTIPMKVYWTYIAACGKLLSCTYLLFAIGYEVLQVYQKFWLSEWSETGSHTTSDEEYAEIMTFYFSIYVVISVGTVIVSLVCNLVGKQAGANSKEILHVKMLNQVVRCPMQFFDSTPTGRIITRFSSDMALIDRKLATSLQRFLQFLFLCISAIAVNAIVNPWILLGAIPIIAIYFFIQRFYRVSSRELQRLEAITRGPIISHFHETLEGLSTIRAFREQNRFTNQMLDKIEANNRAAVFINVGNRWLSTSLDHLGSIIVFLATFASMLSSYLYPDVVTPSMVGLAISYILLVPVYLNQVVKFLAEVEMYMNSVERVNRYAELDIEDYENCNENSPILPEKWPSAGHIEFDNISVQYGPDRPPIITDFKYSITPNQKVGICGRSGCGKSTLLMSLFRISDISKGKILIDGVDIQKIPLLKLRTSLSIIPQENILFSGTIRFNLDPLKKISDEEIWRALELCQMKEIIKDKPGQLDENIKDSGAAFSAGQKQLLGLARAIIHKSKVVIMDEATSSVDLATERTLLEVVKEVFKDCTVLTIAHRLETIVEGDLIIVLDAGKLVETGDPKDLRRKPFSRFATMLRNANEQNTFG